MEEEQEVTTESGKQKLSKSLKAYLCMMNSTYLYKIYLYIFNHIWVIFLVYQKSYGKSKTTFETQILFGKDPLYTCCNSSSSSSISRTR